MKENKLTVQLGFEVDKTGAEEAEAAVQEVQTAVEETAQTATEAAQTTTAAAEKSAAAADTDAEKAERLRTAMELEAKGVAKLEAELQRLIKARRAAAKAGDAKAYEELSKRCDEVRGGIDRMKAGTDTANLSMMGQAQLGMNVASSLGAVAQGCRDGSLSVGDMVGAVGALSAALKAGLGPIGWVMVAIQGLQVAFEAWQGSERAELEKSMEANRQYMESWQKMNEALKQLRQLSRDNELERIKRNITEEQEGIKKTAAEKQRQADVAAAREDAEAAAKMEAIKRELEAEKTRLQIAEERGEMTKEEARAAARAAEDKAAAETEAIQKGLDDAKAAREEFSANLSKETADKLAASLRTVDPLLKVDLPRPEEYDEILKRLEFAEEEAEEAELRAQRKDVDLKLKEVRKMLRDMGIAFEGNNTELLKFVGDLREMGKQTGEAVESVRLEAKAHKDAAETARTAADTARTAAEEQQRNVELQRQLEDDKAQQEKDRRAREEEWAEVQRKSLDEQEKWLKETTAGLKAGSEEAKRWAKEARNLETKQTNEELAKITKGLEKVGNYTEQETRTQAEIFAADEKTLQATLDRLDALKATPNIDAATIAAINEQQRKVRDRLNNLHKSAQRAADEAQKAVEGMQPMQLKAKAGSIQGMLDRVAKHYAELARRAERQAAAGDEEGMLRTQKAMRATALQMERLSGYTGAAAAKQKETENALGVILRGTKEEERGMSTAQKAKKRINAQLQGQETASAASARSAKQAAKDDKRRADAIAKSANDAEKNAKQQEQQKANTANVAALAQQLKQATDQINDLQKELAKLAPAVTTLATAAENCANAARDAAHAAADKLSALSKRVDECTRAIQNLRR